MKTIQLMLTSRWSKLLAVACIAVWCTKVDAAYWNRNRTHTHQQGADLDGDGIPNIVDPDIDNDGIPNALDKNVDGGIAKTGPFAGQFIGDHSDNDSPSELDIDEDGLADDSLAENDVDGDGTNDSTDGDIDGDGRQNNSTSDFDIDGDGLRNDDAADMDDDSDGVDDIDDDDDNNDGTHDIDEANHHNEDSENEVQADLIAQPAAPVDSSVKVTLQRFGTGSAKFAIDAKDLAVGSYEVFVAGVTHGLVEVVQESNKTRGTLTFKTADSGSGDPLLNFPVAGLTVELRQGATVYFSGPAPALPPSEHEEGSDSVQLTRGEGISNLAEAEVVMEFGPSGPTTLEINLQKVPVGDYSVNIGDATRGTLVVHATANGNSGQLDFEIGGSGSTLPLNFPSAGQSIAIVQGTTTWFFGQLPATGAP
jgi:hypothetical protein